MTKDPTYLGLKNFNVAPNGEFLFGTDTLGRDIFSGIWYGGRISITIGFLATLISTLIAVVYGSVSGIAPAWLDTLMMRFTEIFLSVPGLPLEIISWGSMLSLSEKALLTDSWWIIIIPGAFLVTLLMCLTNIGNYLRKAANRKESNL